MSWRCESLGIRLVLSFSVFVTFCCCHETPWPSLQLGVCILFMLVTFNLSLKRLDHDHGREHDRRHGSGEVAKSQQPKAQTGNRKRAKQGMGWASDSSKLIPRLEPPSTRPQLSFLLNLPTGSPIIHVHEPTGAILSKSPQSHSRLTDGQTHSGTHSHMWMAIRWTAKRARVTFFLGGGLVCRWQWQAKLHVISKLYGRQNSVLIVL